jgi:exosortase
MVSQLLSTVAARSVSLPKSRPLALNSWRPVAATAVMFLILYAQPISTLLRDWWNDPEAAHGLLLGPLAIYLAWKSGRSPKAKAQPVLGLTILVMAVLIRYLAGLAAELFMLRGSLLLAIAALIIFVAGVRQLLHWWLPTMLLALSVPIPAVLMSTIALPLQLQASQLGAALLEWRHVPVRLAGNVIQLPGGHSLFVTEACSGLRSLTALIALGLLVGAFWLRSPWIRALLLLITIPVAMLLNGIRVFLTGFLTFYISPELGTGIMHFTEGWVLFVVALSILAGIAVVLRNAEVRIFGPEAA